MRTIRSLVLLACATWTMSGHAAIERFYVAKITDNAGLVDYRVVTPEEFKALDREMDTEARLHTKAVSAARTEWKKSENEGSFASSAAKPRKITKSGVTFRDRGEADEQLNKYLARDARSAASRIEREKERAKNSRSSGRNSIKKSAEAVAREKARDERRDVTRVKSLELYKAQLKVLLDEKKAADEKRAAEREQRGY